MLSFGGNLIPEWKTIGNKSRQNICLPCFKLTALNVCRINLEDRFAKSFQTSFASLYPNCWKETVPARKGKYPDRILLPSYPEHRCNTYFIFFKFSFYFAYDYWQNQPGNSPRGMSEHLQQPKDWLEKPFKRFEQSLTHQNGYRHTNNTQISDCPSSRCTHNKRSRHSWTGDHSDTIVRNWPFSPCKALWRARWWSPLLAS